MTGRLLVDSHVFLWLLQEPEKIGSEAQRTVAASAIIVSAASLWELGIKYQAGKLTFGTNELIAAIETIGASILLINEQHIAASLEVTAPHRDPFDRILLAQAQAEGCRFITADQTLLSLGLPFVITARR